VKPKPKPKTDAPLATRTARVERAHERLTRMLNFDNCPEDYESLKFEAKYLAGLSGYSFAVMAQRLTRIRDGRLYEADGYPDFRGFVAAEIELSRSTVYNYIDVYEYFGDLLAEGAADVEHSKLLPAVQLLRDADERRKDALRKRFWKAARTKTYREIQAEIAALKKQREVVRRERASEKSFTARVREFIDEIPGRPSAADRAALAGLRDHIEELLGNG
jgi:hypothetical protein